MTSTRRSAIKALAALSIATAFWPLDVSASISAAVRSENERAGSRGFRITKPAGDDLDPIGAYCLQSSVRPGERIDICVRSVSTQPVSAEIYRIGYYGGLQGRLVEQLPQVVVAASPTVTVDAHSGLTLTPAPVTFSPVVKPDWLSGLYVVKVTETAGYECVAVFVVRDDRVSDILYQQPNLTYAAYTASPLGIGKSLYDDRSGSTTTVSGRPRAVEVSLDRPHHSSGYGDLLNYEIDTISWLEREGYDISYQTVVDTAADPTSLRRHKVVVSAGHDEYWPQQVMDAHYAARDAGVCLAFFGGNTAYWRVRLTASADGRPNRIMTCYKSADTAVADPSGHPTTTFRAIDQDEQALIGVHWGGYDYLNVPYVPANTDHWFWASTGAKAGQPIGVNIVGYEMDHFSANGPTPQGSNFTLLSNSPYRNGGSGPAMTSNSTIYQAASGAWVWASGSISWGWGLGRSGYSSSVVQTATSNLLGRMLASAPAPPSPPLPFTPFVNAEQFVAQQYSDLLGRGPDAPGSAHWVAVAKADGSGMADVIDQLLSSTEFEPRANVARLYLASFRRVPDPGGFDYWFGRFQAGLDLVSMARHFATSDEFMFRYGPADNRRFVELVYSNVFDRGADTGGWQYWTSRLDGGLTKGGLLAHFSESPEALQRYRARTDVIVTFEGMLQRPPTQPEFDLWVGRLATSDRRPLIRSILAGQEYAGRIGS